MITLQDALVVTGIVLAAFALFYLGVAWGREDERDKK